jgi:hypothetical protein
MEKEALSVTSGSVWVRELTVHVKTSKVRLQSLTSESPMACAWDLEGSEGISKVGLGSESHSQ